MKGLNVIILFLLLSSSCVKRSTEFSKTWDNNSDRVWVGENFWSNRLQDWKVVNGRLECISKKPNLLMRTTHLINYRVEDKYGKITIMMETGSLQQNINDNASSGILIGAGPELDVLGASLIQQKPGPGAGIYLGLTTSGKLFIKDMVNNIILKEMQAERSDVNMLTVKIVNNDKQQLLAIILNDNELILDNAGHIRIAGNIAMVSDPGEGHKSGSFWFNNLKVKGDILIPTKTGFGPVISSQYTLSRNILKLTAQIVPVSDSDPKEVYLELNKGNKWEQASSTTIIKPGYTATFKIENWDSTQDTPFRIVYMYNSDGKDRKGVWEGTVRHDPVDKDEIVIAGFTGNHNIAHPGLSGTKGNFNFNNHGIWYPNKDIIENMNILKPDLLFFSGDQVYEGNSPTFPDRQNYELDYLYKWYLYCLAYRDLTKDIPTISIPDDHDVYQGNVWGQSGRPAKVDNEGGYVNPAWFVKMVDRTQCSNLPDPYDPTPIDQGIGVYYTSMSWGRIGFAILEDRKFKSGCADNPFITKGRPDHIIDPNFDVKLIDLPGKKLLGDRQLNFLDWWAVNWKGEDMKVALSQTIFANMATHHGGNLFRLIADMDSDGWPQTGRNKAIDALRKAFAIHLAGDQHLGSVVHHGVESWDDAIYSFCVPSIANFYPRAWWPEVEGLDRPEGAEPNMGKHKDGFGNFVTVKAVTNPTGFTNISTNIEPLELNDKSPGYGIVRLNKKNRTITMECWPRYANVFVDEPYKGWPITISQFDNYSREAVAWLPELIFKGIENPVVEVREAESNKLVYCVRIVGKKFKPKTFAPGMYSIKINNTQNDVSKYLNNIEAKKDNSEIIKVTL